jgi:glycosidase
LSAVLGCDPHRTSQPRTAPHGTAPHHQARHRTARRRAAFPVSPEGASDEPLQEGSQAAAGDRWRSAVIYQVYVRSFADGDGGGTGDLSGVRERLPYLAELGVEALWFTPWYLSPMADGGYDVTDYRVIDPAFGTLPEAEKLIGEARVQDPMHARSGGIDPGRDGCRVPLPWIRQAPYCGFGSAREPWLPQPPGWERYAADAQERDPGSMPSLYREALRLRRSEPGFGGPDLRRLPAPEGVLAFVRGSP